MRPLALLALLTLAAAPVPKADHPPPPSPKPAPAAAPPARAQPRPAPTAARPGLPALLAALPPEAPGEKLRRLLLQPYATATGTELPALSWKGADGLEALIAEHGADLILLDATKLADLCRTREISKLDWTALDRARAAPGSASDCGAGAYLAETALAWDKARFPGTPAWSDFWDIARHPGRRGLESQARGTLEIALLADGVSAPDIYRTLRTQDGLDRAFRKLDQIKPYIVWWDQPAQAADLLASGKALLTSAPVDTMTQAAASHPGLGFSAEGGLASWFSWAVPQAAPHPAASRVALVIAADPARQADLARATGLGPANTLAFDLLPPQAKPALVIDDGFWAENGAKIQARFAAWMGK
jgi:putative spermidine/putrescine transport system substrate-binding protein